MNQKTVICVIFGTNIECFGSFKKFCQAKDYNYRSMINTGKSPKIGKPVTIGDYTVHKVECK